ncbi:hypothetical protein; putative signal peptide [Frankia alni ACN14a]|uniref:Uncharacterized protein n=1 Tax=Frankia alni (strain DSM 45986 / CECT 9034 / ACN14a) TaxID=326424 RepID=Q0RG89_FRAAA|nr:hypothetical protein; putative signal peptide [Frankia alni ACN14a]
MPPAPPALAGATTDGPPQAPPPAGHAAIRRSAPAPPPCRIATTPEHDTGLGSDDVVRSEPRSSAPEGTDGRDGPG